MSEKNIGNRPNTLDYEGTDMLSAQEVRNLIESMWEEKRGRLPLSEKPDLSLTVAIAEPTYDIRRIVEPLLKTLAETPPDLAYLWSEQWGRARICLSTNDQNSVQFLNTQEKSAKNYHPIISELKRKPSEQMYDERPEIDAYTIVLNDDQPLTMEASILQIERMTDELIWSLTKEYQLVYDMPDVWAFAAAVETVTAIGVNVQYASLNDILNFKFFHNDIVSRIYGNIHNKQVVPAVIGIVVPPNIDSFGNILNSPPDVPDLLGAQESGNDEERTEEIKMYNQKARVLASFTIGKRLHAGHAFHLATMEMTCRQMGRNAEMVFEFNDTGIRFADLLEVGSKELGIEAYQLAELITLGEISTEDVERWYRSRSDAHINPLSDANGSTYGLSMPYQANAAMKVLDRLFPHRNRSFRLSSDLTHDEVLNSSDPKWRGTGFELSKKRILRKEGVATPLLTRASFIVDQQKEAGCTYVDSSLEVLKAIEIAKDTTGREIASCPGAAVGFDFAIASGTGGDVETLESLESWYGKNVSTEVIDLMADIGYIMCTHPIVAPRNHGDSYYNFKDIESLHQAIATAHVDRINFKQKIDNIGLIIPVGEASRSVDGGTPSKRLRDILKRRLNQNIKMLESGVMSIKTRSLNSNTSTVDYRTILAAQGYTHDQIDSAWLKFEKSNSDFRYSMTPDAIVMTDVIELMNSGITVTVEDHSKLTYLCMLLSNRI